ncbi:hypothetical protein MPER_09437 [Moniliophthora perniciosa FA553]|nr:hypothetical protein MPER_09437 [Moniliophthora perniciosa FA553]
MSGSVETDLRREPQTSSSSSTHRPKVSWKGHVGTVLESLKLLVISPNQDFVFLPTLGIRKVRMRRDFHFGEDDPLYFPQLFSFECGHLAVIPAVTTDPSSPHLFAWYTPLQSDFVLFNPNTSVVHNVGKFSDAIVRKAKELAMSVIDKAGALIQNHQTMFNAQAVREDAHLRSYTFGLHFTKARLDAPAEFDTGSI